MYKTRKKRGIIIVSLLVLLLMITVGYAAFQTELDVSGSGKITSVWDVRITNVTTGTATGTAENVSTPTWTDLTAYMEANLYAKGDAMEYDVTVSNRGTLDAQISDVILTPSSSEAVIISYSGFAKNEKILKGQDKIIHVKIEYNSNYNGPSTSGTSTLEVVVEQPGPESEPPATQYLLTYDYMENGGTSTNTVSEYIESGTTVDLTDKAAAKPGYTFVGWNTNKDAHTALQTVTMTDNTTLYAIFSKEIEVSYEKGTNVARIGNSSENYSETYTIYNKETAAEVTLPAIISNDPTVTGPDGWYDGDEKVGNVGEKVNISEDTTLTSKIKVMPIMRSWAGEFNPSTGDSTYLNTIDFHAQQYREKITDIEFVDSINVPDGATNWDVSQNQNESVIAWIVPQTYTDSEGNVTTTYKLYIGGDGGVIAPENLGFAFSQFTNLRRINLSYLDTSNTNKMYGLFEHDSNLNSINFGDNFDTSQVTNFNYMFGSCTGLKSVDISGFDTHNATNMEGMFYTTGISNLDLSNFNTSKVTNMSHMFSGSMYSDLDLSSFDTSKVTTMFHMFAQCSNLTSLDLSNFDTSKVTNMDYMFGDAVSLEELNLNNFDTSRVTYMGGMFQNCTNLQILKICSFNTSAVTDMNSMFNGTSSMQTIFVGSGWTTANATTASMFSNSNVSSVTQSATCSLDSENISLSATTTQTKTEITVIATAEADSGIAGYEFSIDGGNTWETTTGDSASNIHTFTGLNPGQTYQIEVRATSNLGKTATETVSATTFNIAQPQFVEYQAGEVTIQYPTGCSAPYVCKYSINDGEEIPVTKNTTTIILDEDSEIEANVTDGELSASNTYNFKKTDLYIASYGSNQAGVGYGTRSKPYKTLSHAYNKATTSAQTSTIYAMDNVPQPGTTTMGSNKDIVLTSASYQLWFNVYYNGSISRAKTLKNSMIDVTTGSLTLRNISINGNGISANDSMIKTSTTLNVNGGAYIRNAVSSTSGAGVYVRNGGTLNVTSGGITSNVSSGRGGGVVTEDGSSSSYATVNISGGTIGGNSAALNGGGVHIGNYGHLNMTSGTISNNTTERNGGGINGAPNSVSDIDGGTFINNTADYNGGGFRSSGTAVIDGGTFTSNSAKYGGGLYTDVDNELPGNMTINNATVTKNSSSVSGGGIYAQLNTSLTINGGTIGGSEGNKNTAGEVGGGIRTRGTLTITGGTISYNEADSSGGGISSDSNATISGVTIDHNVSGNLGGGIVAHGYTTMTSGTISNNSAVNGGGIYINDNVFTMTGGSVNNNSSSSSGGGIRIGAEGEFAAGGTANVQNNTSSSSAINNNVSPVGIYTDQKAELSITDLYYYIQSAKNTSYVLDVAGGTNANDTNVDVYNRGSSTTARYRWKPVPTLVLNGVTYYHLRTAVGDRYAQVASSGNPASGDNVGIWTYRTDTDFYWYMTKYSSGVYYIRNRYNSNLCLQIQNGNTGIANSQNVNISTCSTASAASHQRWKVVAP